MHLGGLVLQLHGDVGGEVPHHLLRQVGERHIQDKYDEDKDRETGCGGKKEKPQLLFNIFLLPPLRYASVPPTAEGAADVDAHGPHVGLIGVTDAVVKGDDAAGSRTQKTQDQQAHNKGVEGQWGSSNLSQYPKHCRQTQKDWPVQKLTSVLL